MSPSCLKVAARLQDLPRCRSLDSPKNHLPYRFPRLVLPSIRLAWTRIDWSPREENLDSRLQGSKVPSLSLVGCNWLTPPPYPNPGFGNDREGVCEIRRVITKYL